MGLLRKRLIGMEFQDLVKLYEERREVYGAETYQHISELLSEAKEIHHQDWRRHPTPSGDHEQSWRAFKGKNLEKLVLYIIKKEVENLGLKIVNGNRLERTLTKNLSLELNKVKMFDKFIPDLRNLLAGKKAAPSREITEQKRLT